MHAERLLAQFERISEAPDAIPRLRRFILDLAVRGKLVQQDPEDEPAEELLRNILIDSGLKSGKRKSRVSNDAVPSDPPFAAPETWAWTSLGFIGDWGSGSTPPRGQIDFYGGDISWFKSGELNDNKRLARSEETVTSFALEKCSFRLNRPGDVLIAMYGATIGKLAILAETAVTNQAVCACTPSWGVDNEYLFIFLLAQRDAFRQASEGGAQPNISKIKILQTPFPLPPLAEQHRIVAKVDELMALCDQLESARQERQQHQQRLVAASLQRLNQPAEDPESFRQQAGFALNVLPSLTTSAAEIKQLRQTILNLAVRGKLVPGTMGRMGAVGDYRNLQNGYAFKSGWFAKSGIKLLRNANVGHGQIRWDDVVHIPEERFSEFARFSLEEGDIVLTLDRPFIMTGTKVARVKANDLPALLLQRVGRFVEIAPGLDDDYLFLWINSPHFNEQIDPGRSNGVPHISSKQVESASILIPPLAEQHRIVAKVDELMALCDQLEQQLNAGEQLGRKLLEAVVQEAVAGRLPEKSEGSSTAAPDDRGLNHVLPHALL
jgi:type I restriction enzyme S subunit